MFNDVSLQRNNLVQNKISKKTEKDKQENTNTQALTTQQSVNKSDTLTANANELLAMQNLAFVSVNKDENKNIQKLQIDSSFFTNNIDEQKNVYDECYKIAFNPQSDFDTIYSETKNFILELYAQNSSLSQENMLSDFDYTLKFSVNEYIWNKYQKEQELSNNSLETRNATSENSEVSAPVTSFTKTLNGNEISVHSNSVVTSDGFVATNPADFASYGTINIKDAQGKEYSIDVITDDITVENFQNTINQLTSFLNSCPAHVLDDLAKEIEQIYIPNNNQLKNTTWAGLYYQNTNTIVIKDVNLLSHAFAHELTHALDYVDGGYSSLKFQEKWEELKQLVDKYLPEASSNYIFKNVNEFAAEVGAASAGREHAYFFYTFMETLNKNKDKEGCGLISQKFEYLTNDILIDFIRIRNGQTEEVRKDDNTSFAEANLTINKLLTNKSFISTYYKLVEEGVYQAESLIIALRKGLNADMSKVIEKGLYKEVKEFNREYFNICKNYKEQTQNHNNTGQENTQSEPIASSNNWQPSNDGQNTNVNNLLNNNNNLTPPNNNNNNNITPPNTPTNNSPNINQPNMPDYNTPNIGSNNSQFNHHQTNYNGGNINDYKPHSTDSNDWNKSVDDIIKEQTNELRNNAIDALKAKYGADAIVDVKITHTIDEDGNITYHVDAIASKNGQNNTNQTNGNDNGNGAGSGNGNGTGNGTGSGDSVSSGNGTNNPNSSQGNSNNNDAKAKAEADAQLQAGLDWTKKNFTDADGNFDGDSFAGWVNDTYGEGQAYNYTGSGAQNAYNAALDAQKYGNWDNFYNNAGSYNNSGEDWSWTGFDVTATGGNPYGGGIVYNEYGQIDYRNSWFSFGSGGGGGDNALFPEEHDHRDREEKMVKTVDAKECI